MRSRPAVPHGANCVVAVAVVFVVVITQSMRQYKSVEY